MAVRDNEGNRIYSRLRGTEIDVPREYQIEILVALDRLAYLMGIREHGEFGHAPSAEVYRILPQIIEWAIQKKVANEERLAGIMNAYFPSLWLTKRIEKASALSVNESGLFGELVKGIREELESKAVEVEACGGLCQQYQDLENRVRDTFGYSREARLFGDNGIVEECAKLANANRDFIERYTALKVELELERATLDLYLFEIEDEALCYVYSAHHPTDALHLHLDAKGPRQKVIDLTISQIPNGEMFSLVDAEGEEETARASMWAKGMGRGKIAEMESEG